MGEPKRRRMYFLGFNEDMIARAVLEEVKAGIRNKEIVVEDWAKIDKQSGGKTTFTTNKSVDPGAARGAGIGGAAGIVLAALSGPIGAGAVLGGAAIGAATAAIRDSGIKDSEMQHVARLMADGRSGLMISVPMDETETFDAYVKRHVEFESADFRYSVDIVPGRDFDRAVEEYKRDVEPSRERA